MYFVDLILIYVLYKELNCIFEVLKGTNHNIKTKYHGNFKKQLLVITKYITNYLRSFKHESKQQ